MQNVPRIRPTPEHMKALVGTWEFGGQTVHLQGEENSGILVALDDRGERVNPVRVISRGVKLGG